MGRVKKLTRSVILQGQALLREIVEGESLPPFKNIDIKSKLMILFYLSKKSVALK